MAIGFLKKNSLKFGLVLGLLLPMLGVVIYYYWKIAPNSWYAFFQYLKIEKRLLSSLTVVCLLLNVGVFTYYVNTRKDETAKGIFAITLLYGIVSLLVKFFG
jgi:CHASE3 domain sensor protein